MGDSSSVWPISPNSTSSPSANTTSTLSSTNVNKSRTTSLSTSTTAVDIPDSSVSSHKGWFCRNLRSIFCGLGFMILVYLVATAVFLLIK